MLPAILITFTSFLFDASSSPVYNMQPAYITANIGTTGRNIRNLPCVSRKNSQSGVCMFAIDCLKANGTHLGTCIDRFYFGSCCHIEPVQEIIDNSIDTSLFPEREPPSRISSTSKPTTTKVSTTESSKATTESLKTTQKATTTPQGTETTTRAPVILTREPVVVETTEMSYKLTTFQSVDGIINDFLTTFKPAVTTAQQTRPTNKPQGTLKPAVFGQQTESNATKPAFNNVKPTLSSPKPVPSTSRPVLKPGVNATKPNLNQKPSRPTVKPQSTIKPVATVRPTQRPVQRPTNKPAIKPQQNTSKPGVKPTQKPSRPRPTVIIYKPNKRPTLKPVPTTKQPNKPLKQTTKPIKLSTKKPVITKPSTIITKKPVVYTTTTTSTLPPITIQTTKLETTTAKPSTAYVPQTSSREPVVEVISNVPLLQYSQLPIATTTETPIVVSKPPETVTQSVVDATQLQTTSRVDTTSKADNEFTKETLTSITYKPSTTTESNIVVTTEPFFTESSIIQLTVKPAIEILLKPTENVTEVDTNDVLITNLNTSSITGAVNGNVATNEIESEKPVFISSTMKPGLVTWTLPSEEQSTDLFNNSSEEWVPITTPDGWVLLPSVGASQEASPTLSPSTSAPVNTTTQETNHSTSEKSTESTTLPILETSTSEANYTSNTTELDATSTSVDNTSSSTEPLETGADMGDYKEVCGRRMYPEGRIVGGEKSPFGKWPWQISLRQWRTSTYLHKCGAALLNENWAITAAHCVDNVPPSDLLLRLGEHDLSTDSEPYIHQERRVQIVASHPQFDPRTFEYDLALLRFYEPVKFQPNIIPVCVPQSDENFVGRTAYVTGWGRLYEDGPLPSVLQEVSVPVINNTLCESMYRAAGYIEHIPHIFICAGWRRGGFDSCEGDSGGPMVIQRPDKRFLLAGVISWGIGCAEPNQPGVYTRISEFRDWINQILQF